MMRLSTRALLLILLTVLGVVATTIMMMSAIEDARASQCRANLKQIGLAIRNYRLDYGSLPPAFVVDDEGKPMHSWRMLILPYLLGDMSFYNLYDFAEPWNGPNNVRLLNTPAALNAGRLFACPTEVAAGTSAKANYVVVVGNTTLWRGGEPAIVSDGDMAAKGMKVLVVETAGSDIHWMEPRDITLEKAIDGFNVAGHGVSSHHSGKIFYCTVDGRTMWLGKNTDITRLTELLQW